MSPRKKVKKSSRKKIVKKSTKKMVKKKAKKKHVKKSSGKTVKKKAVKKTSKKKVTKTPKKTVKKSKTAKKAIKKSTKTVKKAPKKAVKPTEKVETPEKKPRRKKITYPPLPWTDSDRVKMVVRVLKELVRRKSISDWRLNFAHARSANLYVGNKFKIADSLNAISEDLFVTVYRRFPDRTIGEAQIPLITTNEKETRTQLLEAAIVCEYARKREYALPYPEEVTFPESYDEKMHKEFSEGRGTEIPQKIHKQIKNTLSGQNVKTNSYEVLTNTVELRTMNSNGVDVSSRKTGVYVEVTLSHANEGEEREFHWYTQAVSTEQLDLVTALEQQADIVRDAALAEMNPGFRGDVLLSGRSLLDFFAPSDNMNPLVLHTFAKMKLMGISQLKHGKPLGEFEGEPFTVTSDPHLSLGLMSTPVDDEGTSLEPVDLVRTGIFTNHIATARYAEHMNLPRTGMISNIRISDGATREEHLRGHNYFEIVSFSWFNPDPFSGDFSAEVRLGYHWLRGKKLPFRGGMFTGNVFSNLLNTRFSREVIQTGHYYGPRAVLFKDAHVTKRE